MSDKAKPEFSLDQVSEAETDEEFGLPEFKEHFADASRPAVLRDWSARDFASIYVRFKPHLEYHARRFLDNPSEVEEVVQDAFLYLMTSLPELDSELGVLKFLKWKVRLLSIDLKRSKTRAPVVSLDPQFQSGDLSEEPSLEIERADAAAVVALALAQLQTRQREALLATLYEGRTFSEVSTQMGLSENALRQLLFRARKTFKAALIGEAETRGKSISEILTIASKRAAKAGTFGPALLVALLLAFGSFSPLFEQVGPNQISKPTQVSTLEERKLGNLAGVGKDEPDTPQIFIPREIVKEEETIKADEAESIAIASVKREASVSSKEELQTPASKLALAGRSEAQLASASPNDSAVEAASFQWAAEVLQDLTGNSHIHSESLGDSQLSLHIGTSFSLSLLLDQQASPKVAFATLWGKGSKEGLVAVPTALHQTSSISSEGTTSLELVLTGFAIGDTSGKFGARVLENSHFSEIGVSVLLIYAEGIESGPSSVRATFLPRGS